MRRVPVHVDPSEPDTFDGRHVAHVRHGVTDLLGYKTGGFRWSTP